MSFADFADLLDRIVNETLFTISGTEINLMNLATFAAILLLSLVASRLLRRSATTAMDRRGITDAGTRAITTRLINILVMTVGTATALTNIGINLGALFAAGAVFAVGISFAFQNVAQNFLSGLILLLERSIKPGDILEVEGTVVRVEKLGIRATVARTRDDEQIIIPNTVLAQGTVKNYTMGDSWYRVRVAVGVTYDSDMAQVRQVLEEVVSDVSWAIEAREPIVLMTAFGSSSVDFDVSVWTSDPWRAPRARSRLHEAVWWALKEAGVVIAFPQLDVHFDSPVEDGLSRLPRAS
jgi:small-conductance mechanosensitive channel